VIPLTFESYYPMMCLDFALCKSCRGWHAIVATFVY